MHFDNEDVTKFTERLKGEGNPRVLLSPIDVFPQGIEIPDLWRHLLSLEDADRHVVTLLWSEIASFLPSLTSAVDRTVQTVGLVVTDREPPSLIYVFTKGAAHYARRGFLPKSSLPPVSERVTIDLSLFYRMHDGWIDLMSSDTGPLPTNEWYVIGNSQPTAQDGLFVVFRTGGNLMGFDLSETPAGPYILWSGGKVKKVADFWQELDSWLSNEIEKMDKNQAK
jgi:hypothetical protein